MKSDLVAIGIMILLDILLGIIILTNLNKKYRKNKYGQVIEAKKIYWKVIPGRPKQYWVKVEYCFNDIKEVKRFYTTGAFAKKYKHVEKISIVVDPFSKKVYFKEDTWDVQNFILGLIIFITFIITFAIFL